MQPLSCNEGASSSQYFTPDGLYRIDGTEMGLLGSGAHGAVRLGQHVQTGECVAVKISPTVVVHSACKEMTALTRLDHPHIVRLLGVQVDMHHERVYMIMELCQGGELFDRIAECGGLPEDEARRYFVHIVSALHHCHQNHVYHRDLKPENILLDGQDNAKVADFGLAAVYQHMNEDARYLRHTKVGSVMYAAPEVLTSTAQAGYDAAAADMWSLGIILFSMLSGTLPFQCAAASRCKRYAAVLQQGIQVMCPDTLSPDVTALLARMIHPDPKQRYTPEQALQSQWLGGGLAETSITTDLAEEVEGRARITDAQPRSWTILLQLPEQRTMPGTSTSSIVAPEPSDLQGQPDSPGGAQKRKRDDGAALASHPPEFAVPLPPMTAALLSRSPAPADGSAIAQPPPGSQPRVEVVDCPGAGERGHRSSDTDGGNSSGAASSGDNAPSSSNPLTALPLTGCLTEYVKLWGWEPLPHGTEQLLHNILQTLRLLGLQYTLHEERSVTQSPPTESQLLSSGSCSSAGAGAAAAGRGNRLVVKINFTTLDATGATGRPPGAGASV
mmetsp:Transcript_36477/g.86056  ORF Transcript_36477/g.86056 Transcript_36477/m.86056 type:complete len:557 (-) Transcript_36477:165-1835(-)